MRVVLVPDLDEAMEPAVSEKEAILDKPTDLESKPTSPNMSIRSSAVSATEKSVELMAPRSPPKSGADPLSEPPLMESEEEFEWVEVLYDELLIVGSLGLTVIGRNGNVCYFFPEPTGLLCVKPIDFHGKASVYVSFMVCFAYFS
jgi:hypothetical protein